jgi:hypothetical protein
MRQFSIPKWALACSLLLSAALVFVPTAAADTTVNFDTTPGGTAIANGTDVSNTYASVGVTFSFLPCTLGLECFPAGNNPYGVYAYTLSNAFPAFSPPNVVTVQNGTNLFAFNAAEGTIQANFSTLQSTVSIEAQQFCNGQDLTCFNNAGAPYLAAYDSSGNLVATATTNLGVNTWQLLSVTGSGNISYVQFGAPFDIGSLQIGEFDDLTFGSGGGTTSTPEPSSSVLLAAGIGVMLVVRKFHPQSA